MKKIICLLLVALFCLPLHACTQASAAEDLLADITPQTPTRREIDQAFELASNQFSLDLLKTAYQSGTNCMLSPYSVLSALAMTANGAAGQTLADFEAMFGLSVSDLNEYLASMTHGEELNSANAIWINKEFQVNTPFLQAVADHYDAAVRRAPFNEETRQAINAWCAEQTKDRIPELLTTLSPAAKMCLINALSFDAQWLNPYEEHQIVNRTFTAADGTAAETEMLVGSENEYLETDFATGFCKRYENWQYRFFALLPNEGVSMEDFLDSLTAETLLEAITSAQRTPVNTTMPKIKLECGYDLEAVLEQMGLQDAFTDNANFSAMSETPLKIDSVIHKVYFELDEGGTKAAAATAVIMTEAAAFDPTPIIPKEVHLLRPYLMGIYDRENQTILFLGVINQVS